MRTSRKRRSTTTAHYNPLHTPGRDDSGRIDLDGKPVPFYPVTRGVDKLTPNMQKSAVKENGKRGSSSVNPAAPKPDH